MPAALLHTRTQRWPQLCMRLTCYFNVGDRAAVGRQLCARARAANAARV